MCYSSRWPTLRGRLCRCVNLPVGALDACLSLFSHPRSRPFLLFFLPLNHGSSHAYSNARRTWRCAETSALVRGWQCWHLQLRCSVYRLSPESSAVFSVTLPLLVPNQLIMPCNQWSGAVKSLSSHECLSLQLRMAFPPFTYVTRDSFLQTESDANHKCIFRTTLQGLPSLRNSIAK